MKMFQSAEEIAAESMAGRPQIEFASLNLSRLSNEQIRATIFNLHRIDAEQGGLNLGEAALADELYAELDRRLDAKAEALQARQDSLIESSKGRGLAQSILGGGRSEGQGRGQGQGQAYMSPQAQQERMRAVGQSAVWGSMLVLANPATAATIAVGVAAVGALYLGKMAVNRAMASNREAGLSVKAKGDKNILNSLRDEKRALALERASSRQIKASVVRQGRAEQDAIRSIERQFGKLEAKDRAEIRSCSTQLTKAADEYTTRRGELMRGFAAKAREAGGVDKVSAADKRAFLQDMHANEARLVNTRRSLSEDIRFHQERITDRLQRLEQAKGASPELKEARQKVEGMIRSFQPKGEAFQPEWQVKGREAREARAAAAAAERAPKAEPWREAVPKDERTMDQKAAREKQAGRMYDDVRAKLGRTGQVAQPQTATQVQGAPQAGEQTTGRQAGVRADDVRKLQPAKEANPPLAAIRDVAMAGLESQGSVFRNIDVERAFKNAASKSPLGAGAAREAQDYAVNTGRLLGREQAKQFGVDLPESKFASGRQLAAELELRDVAGKLAKGRGYEVKGINMEGLTPDQAKSLKHIASEGNLKVIQGDAGTGKTFMTARYAEPLQRDGYHVVGVAESGKAAAGLRDGAKLDEARTIDSFLQKPGIDKSAKGTVLILDEAGMVSTDKMKKLLGVAQEHGCKVVMLGDEKQIPAIGAGNPFRDLKRQHGYEELTSVFRQKSEAEREIAKAFGYGKAREAVAKMDKAGQVTVARDTKPALVRNYIADVEAGKNTIALATLNKDVRQLNGAIRAELVDRKILGDEKVVVNGCRDRGGNDLGNLEFRKGERVMFLLNDSKVGVKNGDLARLEGIDQSKGDLHFRLENGDARTINPKHDGYSSLTYGYAISATKSQGVTADRTHIYGTGTGPLNRSEYGYVLHSRHKESAHLYLDQPLDEQGKATRTREQVIDDYGRSMERLANKENVLDYQSAAKDKTVSQRTSQENAQTAKAAQSEQSPEKAPAADQSTDHATSKAVAAGVAVAAVAAAAAVAAKEAHGAELPTDAKDAPTDAKPPKSGGGQGVDDALEREQTAEVSKDPAIEAQREARAPEVQAERREASERKEEASAERDAGSEKSAGPGADLSAQDEVTERGGTAEKGEGREGESQEAGAERGETSENAESASAEKGAVGTEAGVEAAGEVVGSAEAQGVEQARGESADREAGAESGAEIEVSAESMGAEAAAEGKEQGGEGQGEEKSAEAGVEAGETAEATEAAGETVEAAEAAEIGVGADKAEEAIQEPEGLEASADEAMEGDVEARGRGQEHAAETTNEERADQGQDHEQGEVEKPAEEGVQMIQGEEAGKSGESPDLAKSDAGEDLGDHGRAVTEAHEAAHGDVEPKGMEKDDHQPTMDESLKREMDAFRDELRHDGYDVSSHVTREREQVQRHDLDQDRQKSSGAGFER